MDQRIVLMCIYIQVRLVIVNNRWRCSINRRLSNVLKRMITMVANRQSVITQLDLHKFGVQHTCITANLASVTNNFDKYNIGKAFHFHELFFDTNSKCLFHHNFLSKFHIWKVLKRGCYLRKYAHNLLHKSADKYAHVARTKK